MKSPFLVALALLAGCDALPRDPEGTLQRVRTSREFRVGMIAGGGETERQAETAQAFLQGVEQASGARARLEAGAAEPLLTELEEGRLDLVIGELAEKTPWLDRVALLPPLAKSRHGEARLGLSAAARNGENAWIMLLEREARKAAQAGAQ